jgi:hypothetical protein
MEESYLGKVRVVEQNSVRVSIFGYQDDAEIIGDMSRDYFPRDTNLSPGNVFNYFPKGPRVEMVKPKPATSPEALQLRRIVADLEKKFSNVDWKSKPARKLP